MAFRSLRCFGGSTTLSNRCSLQCFGGSTTLTNRRSLRLRSVTGVLSDRNWQNKKNLQPLGLEIMSCELIQ